MEAGTRGARTGRLRPGAAAERPPRPLIAPPAECRRQPGSRSACPQRDIRASGAAGPDPGVRGRVGGPGGREGGRGALHGRNDHPTTEHRKTKTNHEVFPRRRGLRSTMPSWWVRGWGRPSVQGCSEDARRVLQAVASPSPPGSSSIELNRDFFVPARHPEALGTGERGGRALATRRGPPCAACVLFLRFPQSRRHQLPLSWL